MCGENATTPFAVTLYPVSALIPGTSLSPNREMSMQRTMFSCITSSLLGPKNGFSYSHSPLEWTKGMGM